MEEPIELDNISMNSAKAKTHKIEGVYNLDDIMKAPNEAVLWRCFLKGMFNAIAGSSESGKTTLMFQLCLAVIQGLKTFLGFDLSTNNQRALYISLEDGMPQFKKKIIKLGQQLSPEEKDRFRFLFSSVDLGKKLKLLIDSGFIPDLIVIDTWGDYNGGDYGNEKTRSAIKVLREMAIQYQITMVAIHHTNKEKDNIPEKSSIKGASDFEQSCRGLAFVTDYNGKKYLTCVKANHMETSEKNKSYDLTYDNQTGRIGRGTEIIDRLTIVRELSRDNIGAPKKVIDFKSLDSTKYYTYTELVNKGLQEGLKESTIKRRIKDAVDDGILRNDSSGYQLRTTEETLNDSSDGT